MDSKMEHFEEKALNAELKNRTMSRHSQEHIPATEDVDLMLHTGTIEFDDRFRVGGLGEVAHLPALAASHALDSGVAHLQARHAGLRSGGGRGLGACRHGSRGRGAGGLHVLGHVAQASGLAAGLVDGSDLLEQRGHVRSATGLGG